MKIIFTQPRTSTNLSRINTKRSIFRDIIFKLLKDKVKILKSARKKIIIYKGASILLFLIRNNRGQKVAIWHIQSGEKECNWSTKNPILRKTILQK